MNYFCVYILVGTFYVMNEQQGLFIGIPFWVITPINYCVCDPNAQLDCPNLLYFYELLSAIPCNFAFFV